MLAFGTAVGPAAEFVASDDASPSVEIGTLLAGSENDADEQKRIHDQLESRLTAVTEPMDKVLAHLALGNWLLAVPTARPATRWLLGVGEPADAEAIARSAGEALEHITAAEELLKANPPGQVSGAERTRIRRLTTDAGLLKGFAEVMRGLSGELSDQQWSELARGLSAARESETSRIAAAAVVWQAIAWNEAGRRERALAVLPDALTRPTEPFEFVARLLRCRLLSDAGMHAGAMVLATRIGTSCDEWFGNDNRSQIAARKRLAGVVQWSIGRAWEASLKTATRPSGDEAMKELLATIRKDHFADTARKPQVYMLEYAVPIVVQMPASTDAQEKPARDEAPPADPPATDPVDEESDDRK